MEACDLGPNGGLVYCTQTIARNSQWLLDQIRAHSEPMLIFDCPGQVELYVQESALKTLFKQIERECNMRLVVVNLMDSNMCASPSNYLSAVLASTAMMTCMEFPHINVLTKIDLLSNFYESLQFDLSFYTNCQELGRLAEGMSEKRGKLTKKLAEAVEDFSLVAFIPISVNDKDTMFSVLKQVDKALGCGFLYSPSFDEEMESERIGRIEEKYSCAHN